MLIFNRKRNDIEKTKAILDGFREREKTAIWSGAIVVSFDQEPISSGGLPWRLINLLLKVTPPQGKHFVAKTTWKVQETSIALLQPGNEISVKIDASDPNVIYPNIQGAEYMPQ
ncbi:MAG: hypothetical protein Q7J07_10345 [Pelolinea sp.]|nr:hypothetical protein [Pelolinea sp.]